MAPLPPWSWEAGHSLVNTPNQGGQGGQIHTLSHSYAVQPRRPEFARLAPLVRRGGVRDPLSLQRERARVRVLRGLGLSDVGASLVGALPPSFPCFSAPEAGTSQPLPHPVHPRRLSAVARVDSPNPRPYRPRHCSQRYARDDAEAMDSCWCIRGAGDRRRRVRERPNPHAQPRSRRRPRGSSASPRPRVRLLGSLQRLRPRQGAGVPGGRVPAAARGSSSVRRSAASTSSTCSWD